MNTTTATDLINALPAQNRVELVVACLKDATAKALKTNDRIDWLVVEDWEARLAEEVGR